MVQHPVDGDGADLEAFQDLAELQAPLEGVFTLRGDLQANQEELAAT